MADDPTPNAPTGSDDPTVVVPPTSAADADAPLWSGAAEHGPDEDAGKHAAEAAAALEEARGANGASPSDATDGSGAWNDGAAPDVDEKAGARSAAGDKAADLRSKAAEVAEKAGEKTADAREKAGARAAAFAASARERAANADMKELAASTTSLIDTARPFFLAAFAVVFTALGFVAGDSGTAQWFVVGAILFVLAAAFSDELGHIVPRQRPDREE